MKRGRPHGFEVRICFICDVCSSRWFGCSWDVREDLLPVFFLGCGAGEPLLERRRAEARVSAGGEALIVQLCAEVLGVDVRGHLPWVSRCAQETPGEFIHSDRFGTGNLDCTV